MTESIFFISFFRFSLQENRTRARARKIQHPNAAVVHPARSRSYKTHRSTIKNAPPSVPVRAYQKISTNSYHRINQTITNRRWRRNRQRTYKKKHRYKCTNRWYRRRYSRRKSPPWKSIRTVVTRTKRTISISKHPHPQPNTKQHDVVAVAIIITTRQAKVFRIRYRRAKWNVVAMQAPANCICASTWGILRGACSIWNEIRPHCWNMNWPNRIWRWSDRKNTIWIGSAIMWDDRKRFKPSRIVFYCMSATKKFVWVCGVFIKTKKNCI